MNNVNQIQQNLKFFYEKEGVYNDDIPLLIMNKFISFNNPSISAEIDEHFFKINEKINTQRLLLKLPKQNIPYISYFKKNESEDEFEFIFQKIRRYYDLSKREFNQIKNYYLNIFKDKNILKEYFIFFGIDKEKYNFFNLNFCNEKQLINLEKWQ